MPLVSNLRKEILQVLDHSIIPVLKKDALPIAYVDGGLRLPSGITASLISSKVLSGDNAVAGDWPIGQAWPEEYLYTKECSSLAFVYEGFADERMAVSKEVASQEKPCADAGIYALHLPAPSVRYIPAGIPHMNGEKLFWERASPERAFSRILYISIYPLGILFHLCVTKNGKHIPAHNLQTQDHSLMLASRLFIEELKNAPLQNQDVAAAFLLAMMCLLRKNIFNNTIQLANSAWPYLPKVSGQTGIVSFRSKELCEDAVQYIQLHLHEELTLSRIAKQSQVTAQHLNWVFREVLGISVMRYVTRQRVEAAKLILFEREEYLQDIAQLVGFKHYNTFCSVFRRETQMSPKEYRRYSRQKVLVEENVNTDKPA